MGITLGTILLWFGWLGFNGGSAFGANLRAVMACWNSCLTAMFGSITWCLLDYRLARKWSMVGWCSGCISGLVAATPASGFITPWASIILGIAAGASWQIPTTGQPSMQSLTRTDARNAPSIWTARPSRVPSQSDPKMEKD